MPYNTGDFLRWTLVGACGGQRTQTTLDYRVMSAVNVPDDEVLSDIDAIWSAGFLPQQASAWTGRYSKLEKFLGTKLLPPTTTKPLGRLKLLFSQKRVARHDDWVGAVDAQSLPPFVTYSARKVGGGGGFSIVGTTVTPVESPDGRFSGRTAISGVPEAATIQSNPSRLSDTFIAPYYTRVRTAYASMREMTMRVGATVGANALYTIQLMVWSYYGEKGEIRPVGDPPTAVQIYGRLVTSTALSPLVGSQNSRKAYADADEIA